MRVTKFICLTAYLQCAFFWTKRRQKRKPPDQNEQIVRVFLEKKAISPNSLRNKIVLFRFIQSTVLPQAPGLWIVIICNTNDTWIPSSCTSVPCNTVCGDLSKSSCRFCWFSWLAIQKPGKPWDQWTFIRVIRQKSESEHQSITLQKQHATAFLCSTIPSCTFYEKTFCVRLAG